MIAALLSLMFLTYNHIFDSLDFASSALIDALIYNLMKLVLYSSYQVKRYDLTTCWSHVSSMIKISFFPESVRHFVVCGLHSYITPSHFLSRREGWCVTSAACIGETPTCSSVEKSILFPQRSFARRDSDRLTSVLWNHDITLCSYSLLLII